jgi:hypothetical protein
MSVAGLWLLLGCDNRSAAPADAGSTEPSPNASILPAPLATGLEQEQAGPRDAAPADADADAEPVAPEWEREDRALPDDTFVPHDPSGFVLTARFRWPDVGAPPRLPEANAEGVQRAREKTTFDATVELLAAGRMRFALVSKSFVLPEGTEIRARSEGLGHVLVWPNQRRYAVVQPGALRAVLNERRADAQPLTRAKASPGGVGELLGIGTEKSHSSTSFGRLELEQGRVAGAGSGGALLCRLLVEIAGVHPDAPSCDTDLVPLRAEYVWTAGGRLLFEVTKLERAPILTPESVACPPREAEHRIGELPEPASPLLLGRSELRGFRNKPIPTPEPRDAGAPKEGLLALNGGDLTGYVLVDGVPVVHLRPRSSDVLLDLVTGSYSVQVRDFLATEATAPAIVTVPGRFVVSDAPKSEP